MQEKQLEGICFTCGRHIYKGEDNFEWLKVKNGGYSLNHISHKKYKTELLPEEINKRFDDKFGEVQKYHPAYWEAPDKDGSQRAVPNKVTSESEHIKSFIQSEISLAVKQERERIFKQLNTALNKHSKSISEGGLDYVKAFEEVEKIEHELLKDNK